MNRFIARPAVLFLVLPLTAGLAQADPPVASYIFPAGGQRGKAVDFRVGGLYLHHTCSFEMLGPGVKASHQLHRTKTLWLEGPLVPLPESQQAEDYPKDMAGHVEIAADAAPGARYWRVWTSQGATPALKFMVGDLPEVIEQETEGEQVPVEVHLPLTINGRIFPRENVDHWVFAARKGQTICCEVYASRLGSPLDSHLEVLDPHGRSVAENDDTFGSDSFIRFTAEEDGKYQVRIHDVGFRGGPAYVYRLTLTTGPQVGWVYPLGGRRGSTVAFECGTRQGATTLRQAVALPADGAREFVQRFSLDGQTTNPVLLELGDLPEYLEAEPNDGPAQARAVEAPAVCNGRIDRPGDVDYWAFEARKGKAYEFDLRAGRLGSPLDGALVLYDGSGKEVLRSDSPGAGLTDPHVTWTAPANATYRVRIAERFHSRGGPAFAYRLAILQGSGPDFRLQFPVDAVTVNRGGEGRLRLLAERAGGFNGPIDLTFEGLPQGIVVTGTTLGPGQAAADLSFKVLPTVLIGGYHVKVRGAAKIDGRTVTRAATLSPPAPACHRGGVWGGLLGEPDTLLVGVGQPAPFKIVGEHDFRWAPRGSVHHRHYSIQRNGYAGPIEVSLADRQARHLQGVTGPTIVVPAGATEFDYWVQLPPWMETGRTSRTCVMGLGVVEDADRSKHEVSFSSAQPDEQVIVVIEPGRLDIEADRESVVAEPDRTVSIPVRVARGKSLQGAVKVELVVPGHVRGVAADTVVIPADQTRASLPIHFGAGAGPFNMPLVIRATVTHKDEPVVGETKVEVLPGGPKMSAAQK